jgi:hypothetical protein
MFIAGIIVVSLASRVTRTIELRAEHIEFDDTARRYLDDPLAHDGALNVIANRRQAGDVAEYDAKEGEQRGMNPVPHSADIIFLEIQVVDPSQFSGALQIEGVEAGRHRVLRARALPRPTPSPPSCSRCVTASTKSGSPGMDVGG